MDRILVNTGDMENLFIRTFRVRDSKRVIELWKDIFSNDPRWNEPSGIITRKLRRQRDLFLVGLLDNKIVATVLGGYDGFRGWIYHLAVDPVYRKQGIGQTMMAAIEDRIRSQGAVKINLQVRTNNTEVIRFYEALGYRSETHRSLGKLL